MSDLAAIRVRAIAALPPFGKVAARTIAQHIDGATPGALQLLPAPDEPFDRQFPTVVMEDAIHLARRILAGDSRAATEPSALCTLALAVAGADALRLLECAATGEEQT